MKIHSISTLLYNVHIQLYIMRIHFISGTLWKNSGIISYIILMAKLNLTVSKSLATEKWKKKKLQNFSESFYFIIYFYIFCTVHQCSPGEIQLLIHTNTKRGGKHHFQEKRTKTFFYFHPKIHYNSTSFLFYDCTVQIVYTFYRTHTN